MEVVKTKNNYDRFDQAASALCRSLSAILLKVPVRAKELAFEVRVRAGAPLSIICPGRVWFVDENGQLHNLPAYGHVVRPQEVQESIVSLCAFSVHSHQQEMKSGFISIPGGHRAGICGTAVTQDGEILSVRDYSSINLRIARDVHGVASTIVDSVLKRGLCGVLLVGGPSTGKTTVLRDLARQVSTGKAGAACKVAVVDERCEIAAMHDGVPQNDLGPCCDVLSGYPKARGIEIAVRTLSPDIIICDEIGGGEEARQMLAALNSGVCVAASAHAAGVVELLERVHIRELIESGVFRKLVMMGHRNEPGKIKEIVEARDVLSKNRGDGIDRPVFVGGGILQSVGSFTQSFAD